MTTSLRYKGIRLLGGLLASLIILSQFAYAVEIDTNQTVNVAGTSQDSQVTMNVEADPRVFSAIIPAVIPSTVDNTGAVIVPNNIEIINQNVDNAIMVSGISVEAAGGWVIANHGTGPSQTPDTREYSMNLNGDNIETNGSILLTDTSWKIAKGATLPITMDLKVSPQSTPRILGTIANISFTLEWDDEANKPQGPGQETEPTQDQTIIRYVFEGEGSKYASMSGEVYKVVNKADISSSWVNPLPTVNPKLGYELLQWIYTDNEGKTYAAGGSGDFQAVQRMEEVIFRAVINPKTYTTLKFNFTGAPGVLTFLEVQKVGDTSTVQTVEAAADGGNLTYTMTNVSAGNKITPRTSYYPNVILDSWVNKGTGTLAFDFETSEFYDYEIAREEDSGKTGVVELKLVTREAEATYSNVAFIAGAHGKLLSPADNTTELSTYQTRLKWDKGVLAVSFPAIRPTSGKLFERWVNTIDGSNAFNGDTLTAVPITPGTEDYSFTAVYKDQSNMTIYCYTDANSKIDAGQVDTLVIKPGQSGALPTILINNGYVLDDWFYRDNGKRISKGPNGHYLINCEEGGGWYDSAANMEYINIVARCIPGSRSALSEGVGTSSINTSIELDSITTEQQEATLTRESNNIGKLLTTNSDYSSANLMETQALELNN